MNALKVFEFDGRQVRVMDRNGDPWWVAKDVCESLGLDTSNLSKILEEEDTATCSVQCTDQVRQLGVINESGLYSLILRSRKPEAKRFKRWVTHEVLPAIRKTGSYALATAASANVPQVADVRALVQEVVHGLLEAVGGRIQMLAEKEAEPMIVVSQRIGERCSGYSDTDYSRIVSRLYTLARRHGRPVMQEAKGRELKIFAADLKLLDDAIDYVWDRWNIRRSPLFRRDFGGGKN